MLPTTLPTVIKIGGSMMDDEAALTGLCAALANLAREGHRLVLVHGGGKDINRNLGWLHEKPIFKDGLRVTSPAAMKIVEMTLSGSVNKILVSLLNAAGAKAVGISGVDGPTFICEKISGDLGQVGQIQEVRTELVDTLMAGKFLPVVSPISVDALQTHYNVNADDAASALAVGLKAERLIFVSDVEGVRNAEGARVPDLNGAGIDALIDTGVASGGMIPKLRSCQAAVKSGIGQIHICAWTDLDGFMAQVLGKNNSGTVIQ